MMPCDWKGTDRLMSSIRNKRMMSELLKLKLEKLAFDIAVEKYIASEQSYKDVEALQGVKSQTQSICYPSQDQARSLNFQKAFIKGFPIP